MASILESFGQIIGPDTVGKLSKSFGVDRSVVGNAIGAVGPLLLGGMAKAASTPSGAQTLMKAAQEHGGGILGNISSLFGGVLGRSDGPAGLLASFLGPGANSVGASLSKSLGFNVAPLLAGAAPALLGAVCKTVTAQRLDAAGLATTLQKEHREFVENPANNSVMALVNSAVSAGEKAESTIHSYGGDWSKVATGPAAALYLVASADPSGPIGSFKEIDAVQDRLVEIAKSADPTSVLAAAFGSGLTTDMVQQLKSIAPSKDKLIDVIKGAAAAVTAKSPADARAYKDAIFSVAEAAAKASKEGGFLGFGGKLVSKDEQAALDALKVALR
jgi:hypothetical protein